MITYFRYVKPRDGESPAQVNYYNQSYVLIGMSKGTFTHCEKERFRRAPNSIEMPSCV